MEASSGELSMGQLWRLRCGTSYIFLGLGGWQLIDGTFRQYRHLFPAYRQDSHLEVSDPHIAAKPKGSITNTCQLAGLELGPEGAGSIQEKESWSFMYLRYPLGLQGSYLMEVTSRIIMSHAWEGSFGNGTGWGPVGAMGPGGGGRDVGSPGEAAASAAWRCLYLARPRGGSSGQHGPVVAQHF